MNAKIYNGNVQPNPKEYKIWVNDEGVIKTWSGEKWVESASSGGSSSGEGNIEYLDISNLDSDVKKINLVAISNIIKIEKDGDIMCTNPMLQFDLISGSIGGTLDYFANATIAVCIDFNPVIKYPDWEVTNKEFLLENGFTQEELDAIPRITKEEFYNLEA